MMDLKYLLMDLQRYLLQLQLCVLLILFLIATPLTINYPLSIYFFALSHAPPVLDIEIAIYTPETNAPGNNPAIALGPKMIPTKNGVKMTNNPGLTISFNDALVEISTHLS